nr:MAG TPA: hypothetical protein [Caudoviricetes sp.]
MVYFFGFSIHYLRLQTNKYLIYIYNTLYI